MPDINITIPVPDENAAFFAGRDMIVTPVTDREAMTLATGLDALEKVLTLNRKTLTTLRQAGETKSTTTTQIAKTLDMLIPQNVEAEKLIIDVRTILGRSARVGPNQNRGKMQ